MQARDLSLADRPIGGFLSSDGPSAEDWQRYRLSDEQVAFFHEHGYLSGVQVLNESQLAQLREELAMFLEPAHPGSELWYEYHSNESTDPTRVLFHALGGWRIAPGFHDLLWHPAITIPASQLLGGSPRFWHDQLFCKPARHGGVVAWHQDYSYWTRTVPMAHLTCWIGLDDADLENGCVQYVPGSHRWQPLPMPVLSGELEAIGQELNDEQRQALAHPVAAVLKAGQAVFHHPLTLHGSGPNNTARPRRAAVVNLCRDGVTSQSDEPLLAGVPVIPPGEPLSGQFFPLLLDAAADG